MRTGTAEHSPIAATFIAEVWKKLGICIAACYLQSGTHPVFSEKRSIGAQIRAGGIPFVNEDILTVYIHTKKSAELAADRYIKNELFDILSDVIAKSGEKIEYPRLYLPEEMQHYGWYNTPRGMWDMSAALVSVPASSHSVSVFIECIDRDALWNILYESRQTLSRCDFVREIGAKVYCANDKARADTALYVIVSPETLHEMNISLFKKAFAEYAYRLLKPRDLWDVITSAALTPVVTEWNALTKEQKFEMLRG